MEATKQKYNWPILKQEFFVSDDLEVKAFFERKYGNYNGHISRKTFGWTKDKQKFAKKILNRSLDMATEKRSIEMVESLEKVFEELQRRINKEATQMSVRELKVLWEVFMTMNGESTRVMPKPEFMGPKRYDPDALTLEEKQEIERVTDVLIRGCDHCRKILDGEEG